MSTPPRPVAVVTGAGRGVGRRLAERLARRGYHVVATDIDEGAAMVTGAVVEGTGVRQDVRDPDSHDAVAALAAAQGSLAVWVNNAGVLAAGDAWDLEPATVRRQVEVNLMGVIWGCNAAVRAMTAAGSPGTILNVASMSSLVAAPGIAAYGATKHGVLGYSLSLAGELQQAGRPITVSALCPDVIKSDMTDAVTAVPAARMLFARGALLTVDEVAAAADQLIRQPRLVRALPGYLGALTHLARPFPGVGLRVLAQIARWGKR